MKSPLSFYQRFCQLGWPKSYIGKFLLVAFVGVHVPLIALVSYVALRESASWSVALPVLLVALAATLVGTAATLLVQGWLLAPVLRTSKELDEYRRTRKLPQLPTDYTDEAGVLMSTAQGCVTQLEALLAMKRDLLTVISHDTRNPIGQIMTGSQLIGMMLAKPTPDFAGIKRVNEMIRNGGERQLKIMDDLMLLVRSEREAITVSREAVELGALLDSTLADAELQAERKGIDLRLDNALAGAPSRLLLDAAKTSQVLNNLTHNAIKFTPERGTVALGAKHEQDARGSGWLVFTVQDTGIGMNETLRQALFTPFSKAGRKGTNGEASSGLGLWICKTFTEAQGGRVEVESQEGGGTRFTVRLPWTPAPAEEKAAEHSRTDLVTAGLLQPA